MGDNPATFRYTLRVTMNGRKKATVGPFPAWGFKAHLPTKDALAVFEGVKALQGKPVGAVVTIAEETINGNKYVRTLTRDTDDDRLNLN